MKRIRTNKRYIVPDDAPLAELLPAFQYQWMKNPLWRMNTPGIPDPRKDPQAAKAAALDICYRYDTRRDKPTPVIALVAASTERRAA